MWAPSRTTRIWRRPCICISKESLCKNWTAQRYVVKQSLRWLKTKRGSRRSTQIILIQLITTIKSTQNPIRDQRPREAYRCNIKESKWREEESYCQVGNRTRRYGPWRPEGIRRKSKAIVQNEIVKQIQQIIWSIQNEETWNCKANPWRQLVWWTRGTWTQRAQQDRYRDGRRRSRRETRLLGREDAFARRHRCKSLQLHAILSQFHPRSQRID